MARPDTITRPGAAMTLERCRECRGSQTIGYEDREVTCPSCDGEGEVLCDEEAEDDLAPPPTDADAPEWAVEEREERERAGRRELSARWLGEMTRATAWRDVA